MTRLHLETATRQMSYEPNKGLDKDKDKKITVAEITVTIRKAYTRGMQPGYLGWHSYVIFCLQSG